MASRSGFGGADTQEKQNVGELWAEKSAGKGLFLMTEKQDSAGRGIDEQLLAKVGQGVTVEA